MSGRAPKLRTTLKRLFARRPVIVLTVCLLAAASTAAARHAHPVIATPQAAGAGRATPGIDVKSTKLHATTAVRGHLPKATRLVDPKILHLRKAHTAVFDVRDLRGKVVKREPPEPGNPFETESAASTLPPSVPQKTIAAAANAPAPAPEASFDGLDYATWGAGHPPDENGDVGPSYYIQTVNSSIGIYDKSNGTRVAAFTFDAFMSQGHFGNLCDTDNFGDPVVLYDSFEDRWFITDFAFQLDSHGNVVNPPGAFQCFAVSKTGDPVTGGWNFYSIAAPGALNDYPKFGVWPDGIYMSANMFGYPASGSYTGYHVWALDKQQMYAGAPSPPVVDFAGSTSDFTVIPANSRLQAGTPPAGEPEFFVSTEQFLNALSIYKFHVDWNTPANSTFTGPQTQLQPNCWPNADPASAATPANAADTLSIRAMAEAQYTNLGGTESLWVDHTVERGVSATNTNCNAPKGGNATIRWYQANVTAGNVATNVIQGQSFDPDGANTNFRFMPSLAVDRLGDMAVGYTKSNATTNPQIKYAGRLVGDPVNTLGQSEQTLINGTGAQSGNCGSSVCTRWGDYSGMSLDPDGCRFWMTGEYYGATGLNDLTRIGSFRLSPSCTAIGNGTVSGTVTDGTTAVAGATVALGSRTTTTDGSGHYSFSVPAGTYPSLSASKNGYSPQSFSMIAVPDGGTATHDFALTSLKANQAITITTHAPASASYGTTFFVAATASSGLTVSFSSSGSCSNAGTAFTITSGSGTCTVKYDQAGNTSYNPAPEVTESVTAVKANQSITVDTHAPATAVYNTSFDVAAHAAPGLPLTYSSAGACTNTPTATHFTMSSGTGTCTVKYDQPGNANYNAATEVTESVTAQKADQTITVSVHAPVTKGYGESFIVSATATSALTVAYTHDGVCSNIGSSFTMTSGTGTCTVKYDQPGNGNYNAAPQVTEQVTATKGSQAINVTTHAPASAVYGTSFDVAATGGGSGNPVTFSHSGPCSNSGGHFTITSGSGTCTVEYDQAGDANYDPAPEVTESVTAQKADQAITITIHAPAQAAIDDPFTVAATASSGNLIAYSSEGACTNSGADFTAAHSTGTCTVKYDQPGDGNYNAAPEQTESVLVKAASQTITVTTHAPASAVYGTSFTVAATAPVVPVTYSSSGACTNNLGVFTMTSGTGTCTVKYDQAGDSGHTPAPEVTESVTAQKQSQTIAVSAHAPSSAVFGTSFSVAATASSGLGVAISGTGSCNQTGNTFTMTTGTGTCSVRYDQAGNANYAAAAQLVEAVTAQKASQTITVTVHAPARAVSKSSFTVSATASSGLPVVYSSAGSCSNVGATFTMTKATGTCTVLYDQAGDLNFNAAPQVTESVAAKAKKQPPRKVTLCYRHRTVHVVASKAKTLRKHGAKLGACKKKKHR